jgi:hypothetical protein
LIQQNAQIHEIGGNLFRIGFDHSTEITHGLRLSRVVEPSLEQSPCRYSSARRSD